MTADARLDPVRDTAEREPDTDIGDERDIGRGVLVTGKGETLRTIAAGCDALLPTRKPRRMRAACG